MVSELCFQDDQMCCPHAESERRSSTKSTEHGVHVKSRKLPNAGTDEREEQRDKALFILTPQ